MLRRLLIGSVLVVSLALIGVAWAAGSLTAPKAVGGPVYSALLDYEDGWVAGTNPNGVWRYGWSPTITGPLTLFTHNYIPLINNNLEHGWDDPVNTQGFIPSVARNSGGDYNDGNVTFDAGALIMHQGVDGQYAHVVFTAPARGHYTVATTFYAQQNGINVDVNVLVKGKVVFTDAITSNGESRSFAGRYLLKAGETVDFAVGPNGLTDMHAGNTGLEAVISAG